MSAKFTSYRPQVERKINQAIRAALTICGGTAEAYAKAACPVRTGVLRNSIAHEPKSATEEAVGTGVEYAPYVELGTCKMSAQPYLRPAVENHQAEYANIIKSELTM